MTWFTTWNMLAVSDTSPISNLAAIGRLDLLKSQFPEIWIPTAVAEELKAHPDPKALAAIENAIGDQWIRPLRHRTRRCTECFYFRFSAASARRGGSHRAC